MTIEPKFGNFSSGVRIGGGTQLEEEEETTGIAEDAEETDAEAEDEDEDAES